MFLFDGFRKTLGHQKMEFNPSRLILARKRRGLSKTALAEQSGISVRSLGYYESKTDSIVPSDDHIDTLAKTLELPVEFFFGSDIEELTSDAASFRALTTMTAAQRDSALAAGAFANMVCEWIEKRFALPTPSIPSLRSIEPETAAQALRAEWGLGERPLNNIVHLLEVHGVRVFSLPVDSRSVDAFSLWHRGKPFVFLNTKKSAEHSRFDAAHELGHLALHTHGVPRSRESELEADRFASAFLMPRGGVFGHTPPASTISAKTIHKHKKYWGVAALALVHRLHKLGIIREWQYRTLCIELTAAGYRKREDEMPRDTSQVFDKVFKTLRAEGVTRGAIARDLSITSAELDSLLVGLVIASVANAQPENQQVSKNAPTRATSTLKAV
jgi:Zn-dependent peptidase ImmA (M78 family)/transcriptional regulator with XRE-family HTH domain